MSSPRSRVKTLLAYVGGLALALLFFFWVTDRGIQRSEVHPVTLEVATAIDEPFTVTERPRNIILLLADGLGFAHLAAARAAHYGIDGEAVWDAMPVSGWQRTHPLEGMLTDSASSATALATGEATSYGFVGVDSQGRSLTTLFERATEYGYRTGIVTDSYVWDASPAAFVAETTDRGQAAAILEQLAAAPLDVLFGELEDVGEGEVPTWAETVTTLETGYQIFGPEPVTVEELVAADPGRRVGAFFEEDQVTDLTSTPNLQTLVQAGLQRISRPGDPFVLLVESEELDSASHENDLERALAGMEAIEAVLGDLLEFAEPRGDTLVLFTSDHETGGLAISTVKGNRSLKAIWGSVNHTGVPVPVLAMGPGSELFWGQHTNWQVGRRLLALVERPPAVSEDAE